MARIDSGTTMKSIGSTTHLPLQVVWSQLPRTVSKNGIVEAGGGKRGQKGRIVTKSNSGFRLLWPSISLKCIMFRNAFIPSSNSNR